MRRRGLFAVTTLPTLNTPWIRPSVTRRIGRAAHNSPVLTHVSNHVREDHFWKANRACSRAHVHGSSKSELQCYRAARRGHLCLPVGRGCSLSNRIELRATLSQCACTPALSCDVGGSVTPPTLRDCSSDMAWLSLATESSAVTQTAGLWHPECMRWLR